MDNKNDLELSLAWIYDIYLLGQKASLEENSKEVQDLLIAKIITAFDASSGCLAEYDEKSDELLIVAGIGLPEYVVGSVIKGGSSILSLVTVSGEPLLLNGEISKNNAYNDIYIQREGSTPSSAMCWPLIIGSDVIGVVSVNRDSSKPEFGRNDLEFGQNIVKFIALAVEDARLHIQSNLHVDEQRQLNRLQVIWAEALSWLNQVPEKLSNSEDAHHFIETAAFQSVTISNALWGAICTFNDGQITKTVTTKECNTDDDLIMNVLALSNNISIINKNAAFFIDTRKSNEIKLVEELNKIKAGCYIISPIYTIDSPRLSILLYVGDRNNIAETEFVTFTLFLDGLHRVLQHQELFVSLRESKNALEKEKEEQKSLIEELKNAQDQLLQSEKLASIGQLAAGVAHEINNPVGYISSNISSLSNYVDDMISLLDLYAESEQFIDSKNSVLEKIKSLKDEIDIEYIKEDLKALTDESIEGVKRVKQIVQDLKDFSHVDEAEWQWADIHKGLDSTLNVVNNEIKYKADVVKEYGSLPLIECIPSQLNQVFMNMLVNAAHAIDGDRGLITIKTGIEDDNACFEFTDTGKGISPEKIHKIFDPFFTTKPVGKGTGLGLSLSYGIIEKHQGKIEVDSEVGVGTRFKISIPVKCTSDAVI